jgi:hypothetical protein
MMMMMMMMIDKKQGVGAPSGYVHLPRTGEEKRGSEARRDQLIDRSVSETINSEKYCDQDVCMHLEQFARCRVGMHECMLMHASMDVWMDASAALQI